MYLELDPRDLKTEYQKRTKGNSIDQKGGISNISFYMFNAKAQMAIKVVGKGSYYSQGKKSYRPIYSPED